MATSGLAKLGDPRTVVTDPSARYFGADLAEDTLVPADGALLGETTYQQFKAR
ncbi:hypothetical protein [Actinoplanes sp. G11-F43]|uniref:hypothetical protein n=1 Tax=Actinoplanes sp. G11-F43 TaxID=3424130 RepID=UPI003D32D927